MPLTSSMTRPRDTRFQLSQIMFLAGLASIVISCLMAFRGKEPFATWLFLFTWWGYILFMDAWVFRRKGESLLLSYPGRFFFLAVWSVGLWFVFELINLRLGNWFYMDLPAARPVRWIGYILSFATVVPALMETADLVDASGMLKGGKTKPLGWKLSIERYFVVLGVAMLILPLVWPTYFFPLVWGSLILLLEPLNERLGAPSLLGDWRNGQLRGVWVLLISGFLCGVLWETWNALSRARWLYEIPGVGGGKIFAMPLLGYLGFPPFAIEVFVTTSLATFVWQKSSKGTRAFLLLCLLGFSVAMCLAVDRFTVRSFQG